MQQMLCATPQLCYYAYLKLLCGFHTQRVFNAGELMQSMKEQKFL